MSAPGPVETIEDGPLPVEVGGPLRVRPPRPLPRWVVAALVGALAVAVLVAAVAVRHDRGATPDGAWRGLPQLPRGGERDRFTGTGLLGGTDRGASLPWSRASGWAQADGFATAGPTRAVVTVDAGAVDVVASAQVAAAGPGAGVVVSASPDGRTGLAVVGGGDGWEVVELTPQGEVPLAELAAPRRGVVVQLVRRGDRLDATVTWRRGARSARVDLGADGTGGTPPAGTHVGLVGGGPGTTTRVDGFGYLALPTR